MASEKAPFPTIENPSADGAAGGSSLVLNWSQLNIWLFNRLQSGSLSPDAVAGVTTATSTRQSMEDVTRRRREEDRAAYQTLININHSQRELFELAQEILDFFDSLIKIDPRNARRLERWGRFQDQEIEISYSIDRLGREISKISNLRESTERDFYQMIHDGLESNGPEKEAADIVDRRRKAGGQVITVTYRMGDEVGAMPQHLVYEDEHKKRYIKNVDGTSLYIDDMPISAEEKLKMHAEIDRQRSDRRYTRDGNVERFGNESPDSAQEFEETNGVFKQKIASGNSYMLVYDELMAQGRALRNSLAEKRKEYEEIVKQREELRIEMGKVEAQIESAPEARGIFRQLRTKMTELKERERTLGIDLASHREALSRRFDVVRYMTGSAHSEEALLKNLPDEKLRQQVTDQQALLRERLRKIQEMEEQLATQKASAERQAGVTTAAVSETHAIRESFVPRVDPATTRGEWVAGGSASAADLVRDAQGRVVSYDREYGLFYTTIINEKSGAPERLNYRDPMEIVGFFKDSWERGKQFGNEQQLSSLKLEDHLADVELSVGFSEQASQAIQQSLTMQQNLLSAERTQIQEALRTGIVGGGGPSPEVAGIATNQSVASQVAPESSTSVSAFNTVAPVMNPGLEIADPNNGNLNIDKKKPVISMTSDAARNH